MKKENFSHHELSPYRETRYPRKNSKLLLISYQPNARAALGNIGARVDQACEVPTKATEDQYSSVRLEQGRLESLLCPRHLRAFENKDDTS